MNNLKLWFLTFLFIVAAIAFLLKIMKNVPLEESCNVSVAEFRDLQNAVKELQGKTNEWNQSYTLATSYTACIISEMSNNWTSNWKKVPIELR